MTNFLKTVVYGGLFIVPFLTLYVSNDSFFPYITGKNFWFRIIVEIVVAAWLVLSLLEVKYRPKFSWVMVSSGVLLVVMFFANLFGEHVSTGFFSNFERMDGYITLVHVLLYALVLGSFLTTKQQWTWYLHATLFAAFIAAVNGFAQNVGWVEGYENRRVESYLGNAAYLSIYMLFHIFFAFWLFVESKVTWRRVMYAFVALLCTYVLFESGTRGTVLGLIAGVGVMSGYIILFGSKYKEFRRYAIGVVALVVVSGGVLLAAKDSAFVQENASLARIANINLSEDLKVRGTIWGMAWEGVKERPILGWGQGNFNYIFNTQYDPFLFNQEQWFDRTHNIILDWLVAGGFLGLIAYLSIFLASVYYLAVRPLLREDTSFTVLERGVLLGILVGYFVHNLVVFDNIVSYIFFALILGLIHSRVATPVRAIEQWKVDSRIVTQMAAPAIAIGVAALIFTLNVPGMQASSDIIDSYKAKTPADSLAAYKRALGRESFAQQEVTEQLAQQAMTVARATTVDPEVQQEFISLAESELKRLVAFKPGDARIHVFFGTFYRTLGNLPAAEEQMNIARELSPNKQSIILQQGAIAFSKQDYVAARDFFKTAYDLDERNEEARTLYIAMLFANGEGDEAKKIIADNDLIKSIALSDFVISAINQAGDEAYLTTLYETRIQVQPEVDQNWASLSFLYQKQGMNAKAIETLRAAASARPTFAKSANCIADNLEAGRDAQLGCQ